MLKDYVTPLNTIKMPPRKRMVKKGTIDIDMVEVNMVEWKGRLMRFEWARPEKMHLRSPEAPNSRGFGDGYFRFTDMETEEHSPAFAHGFKFGSGYTETIDGVETAFAYGSDGTSKNLYVFRSTDLEHWESKKLFDFPESWVVFNSSVCKGPDGYVMALEFGGPTDMFGVNFTILFLRSTDLFNWTFMDTGRHCYTRDRYSACPVIRYVESDGFYYMIYLEGLPSHHWQPYIVRTQDFETWELGVTNPIFYSDEDDKKIPNPDKFTPEQIEHIRVSPNVNNSDVDVYEFNGKTVILYCWGNQVGTEFLAEAEYDGSLAEFLQSFYP